MSNQKNKHHLQEHLSNSWSHNTECIPPGCTFIFGGMTSGPAKILSSFGILCNDHLSCDEHEESDTRIFAHLAYSVAQQGCRRAVILATDTDILMLSIYHVSRIEGFLEFWMQKFGIFIPCHWIAQFLSSQYSIYTSSSILSTYPLAGCDSVRYIYNCGKKRALKIALDCDKILQPLTEYGMPGISTEISDAIKELALKYVCALYGRKDFSGSSKQKHLTFDPCLLPLMHSTYI